MYDALRKGFAFGTGDILGWTNSDDLQLPWTLRTVAAIFKKFPNVQWLSSLTPCTFNELGGIVHSRTNYGYSRDHFRDGLLMDIPGQQSLGYIQQESTFWTKELFDKVGGLDTKYRLAGDFDLWARFFKHSDLYGVGCVLGGFRCHGDQLTQKFYNQYIAEANNSLVNNFGDLKSYFLRYLNEAY